ncbi:MAG: type II secretion system F family protein [Armatimonadota bacterium]|jgi:type IV pilus assembly protein PilC
MATFAYVAVDAGGREVKGRIPADSRDAAEAKLRDDGYHVVDLQAARQRSFSERLASLRKVKLRELVIFSRQFATMINAGMNLMKCLDVLRGQTGDERLKKIIDQARSDIASGQSLTEALSKHPRVFSPLYVNMIKAAEAGGILDVILNRLASYLEKEMEVMGKIKSAMVYPVIVLVFSILMTLVLVFFILPKFKTIFDDIGVALPLSTKLLLDSSYYAIHYWYVPVAVVVGTIIGYRAYTGTETGRYHVDALKLRLPIVGDLVRKMSISRFSRTFATLISSGVATPTALDIVSATTGNAVIEKAVQDAKQNIMHGDKLSSPLMISGVFPDMITQMISVGEETGRLDEMLTKVSDFYDEEVDAVIKGLTSIIEPVLIVGLGLLVGFVAVSVITPIYNLVGQAGNL